MNNADSRLALDRAGIADYEFVRLIGTGNNGVFYLANRPERLHIAADLIGDNKQAITTLREHGACDVSFGLPGLARFRVNVFIQRGSCAVVMRVKWRLFPRIAINLSSCFISSFA